MPYDVKALRVADMATFDSQEELEFNEWLREARSLDLVATFIHHPPAFKLSPRVSYPALKQLKTKVKEVEAFLFHPHEYTPDFEVVLTGKGIRLLQDKGLLIWPPPRVMQGARPLGLDSDHMFIDVKGGFSRFHDDKPFSINQKWVFDKYGIYVYKVIPEKWFKKSWIPLMALTSPKKGKIRDKYRGCNTINEIRRELNA